MALRPRSGQTRRTGTAAASARRRCGSCGGAEGAGGHRDRACRSRVERGRPRPAGRRAPLSSPARNASPAPLVSTTSATGAAGTSIQPSGRARAHPRSVGAHREPAPAGDRSRQVGAWVGQPRGADQQHVGGRGEVARVVGEAVGEWRSSCTSHQTGTPAARAAASSGRLWSARSRTAASSRRAEGKGTGCRGRQLEVERDAGPSSAMRLTCRSVRPATADRDGERDPRVGERGADQCALAVVAERGAQGHVDAEGGEREGLAGRGAAEPVVVTSGAKSVCERGSGSAGSRTRVFQEAGPLTRTRGDGRDPRALGWAVLQVAATSCSPLRMVTMTRLPARATALVGALMLLAACSGTPEPSARRPTAARRRRRSCSSGRGTRSPRSAPTPSARPATRGCSPSPPQEHIVGRAVVDRLPAGELPGGVAAGHARAVRGDGADVPRRGRRRVGRRGDQPHDRPGRRPAPAGRARRTAHYDYPGIWTDADFHHCGLTAERRHRQLPGRRPGADLRAGQPGRPGHRDRARPLDDRRVPGGPALARGRRLPHRRRQAHAAPRTSPRSSPGCPRGPASRRRSSAAAASRSRPSSTSATARSTSSRTARSSRACSRARRGWRSTSGTSSTLGAVRPGGGVRRQPRHRAQRLDAQLRRRRAVRAGERPHARGLVRHAGGLQRLRVLRPRRRAAAGRRRPGARRRLQPSPTGRTATGSASTAGPRSRAWSAGATSSATRHGSTSGRRATRWRSAAASAGSSWSTPATTSCAPTWRRACPTGTTATCCRRATARRRPCGTARSRSPSRRAPRRRGTSSARP